MQSRCSCGLQFSLASIGHSRSTWLNRRCIGTDGKVSKASRSNGVAVQTNLVPRRSFEEPIAETGWALSAHCTPPGAEGLAKKAGRAMRAMKVQSPQKSDDVTGVCSLPAIGILGVHSPGGVELPGELASDAHPRCL